MPRVITATPRNRLVGWLAGRVALTAIAVEALHLLGLG
jgi:hypothetical protein